MKKIYKIVIIALVLFLSNNIIVQGLRSKERSLDLYISNFDYALDQYEVYLLVNQFDCQVDVSEDLDDEYLSSKFCELEIIKLDSSIKKARHLHQFMGEIPRSFKVQIITETEIFTSQVVTEEAYNGIVYYDVSSDKITNHRVFINIFALAMFFLILALIAKLFVFYLCKFIPTESIRPFLYFNLVGVSLISIILSMSNYLNGYLYSFKTLVILSLLLLLIELVTVIFTYKKQNLKVKLIYSLIANIMMFIVGGVLILITII